jgi:hypothetical protein
LKTFHRNGSVDAPRTNAKIVETELRMVNPSEGR